MVMIDLEDPVSLHGSGNGSQLGWVFHLHRETNGTLWCALRHRHTDVFIPPLSQVLTVDGWRPALQDNKPRTWWGTLQELDDLLKGQ